MRRPVLFLALALSSTAAAIVACTADDNTQPGTHPKDASLASDTGTTGDDTGTGSDTSTPEDSASGDDSSTTTDAPVDSPSLDAADAADAANPCPDPADGGDAGYVTLQADWNFAVSAVTLNDGGGQLLSIHRCDSIQWTNTDSTTHSVQSNTNAFVGTAAHAAGAYTPIQFPAEGTFGYHCGVHGINAMRGTVTVLP